MDTKERLTVQDLTTDQLFDSLPSFINEKGELYHFDLMKGKNRILISYKQNDSEGGKYLGQTYRGGESLKEALKNMLEWLIKFGYIDGLAIASTKQ